MVDERLLQGRRAGAVPELELRRSLGHVEVAKAEAEVCRHALEDLLVLHRVGERVGPELGRIGHLRKPLDHPQSSGVDGEANDGVVAGR